MQCAQPSWDETTFNQLCEQEEREQATPCGTCTPSSRLSALQQQQQPWHVPWWMYHDRHPMTVRVKLEDVCFDKSNDDSEDDRDNWKRLLSNDAEFQQQQQGLLESVLTRGVHNRYWHFALVRDEVGFTVIAGVQHAQLRVPAWLARGTGSNEALAATSDVSSALSASEASQRLVAYWRAKPMVTTRFINGKYKLLSSTTGLWSFKPPSYTAERHIIGDWQHAEARLWRHVSTIQLDADLQLPELQPNDLAEGVEWRDCGGCPENLRAEEIERLTGDKDFHAFEQHVLHKLHQRPRCSDAHRGATPSGSCVERGTYTLEDMYLEEVIPFFLTKQAPVWVACAFPTTQLRSVRASGDIRVSSRGKSQCRWRIEWQCDAPLEVS